MLIKNLTINYLTIENLVINKNLFYIYFFLYKYILLKESKKFYIYTLKKKIYIYNKYFFKFYFSLYFLLLKFKLIFIYDIILIKDVKFCIFLYFRNIGLNNKYKSDFYIKKFFINKIFFFFEYKLKINLFFYYNFQEYLEYLRLYKYNEYIVKHPLCYKYLKLKNILQYLWVYRTKKKNFNLWSEIGVLNSYNLYIMKRKKELPKVLYRYSIIRVPFIIWKKVKIIDQVIKDKKNFEYIYNNSISYIISKNKFIIFWKIISKNNKLFYYFINYYKIIILLFIHRLWHKYKKRFLLFIMYGIGCRDFLDLYHNVFEFKFDFFFWIHKFIYYYKLPYVKNNFYVLKKKILNLKFLWHLIYYLFIIDKIDSFYFLLISEFKYSYKNMYILLKATKKKKKKLLLYRFKLLTKLAASSYIFDLLKVINNNKHNIYDYYYYNHIDLYFNIVYKRLSFVLWSVYNMKKLKYKIKFKFGFISILKKILISKNFKYQLKYINNLEYIILETILKKFYFNYLLIYLHIKCLFLKIILFLKNDFILIFLINKNIYAYLKKFQIKKFLNNINYKNYKKKFIFFYSFYNAWYVYMNEKYIIMFISMLISKVYLYVIIFVLYLYHNYSIIYKKQIKYNISKKRIKK